METKYAKIPEIKKGVVFSDPWYDASVWCQYRKSFSAKNWFMKMDSSVEDGYVFFQMLLGRPTASHNITTAEDREGNLDIKYPSIYELKQVELGMDTACIFCGNQENWKTYGESAALHTGTDGFFGDLVVFTCKGEDDPAGFLLMGNLDETFGNAEDIFNHMVSSFNGFEISKEHYVEGISPNALAYQLCAAAEAKSANIPYQPRKDKSDQEPQR